MTVTQITQPVDVTIWEGCTGVEKVLVLQDVSKRVAVEVPKGIRDGHRIRITVGARVYLIPVILNGDGFHTLERDGTMMREIILTESSLRNGGQIEVVTPYGSVKLTIAPNSEEGYYWTVKGWGYPQGVGASTRGDLVITARNGDAVRRSDAGARANSHGRRTGGRETGRRDSSSEEGTPGSGDTTSLVEDAGKIIGGVAFIAILLYGIYFYFYPTAHAFSDGDPGFAVDIVKWNFTHFPPSQGPVVRCVNGALETPEAEVLIQRALNVGRDLETQHGYDFTDRTRIGVFQSLGEQAGFAHYAGGENCIQLELNSYGLEDTIRHEWAHIAAGRETENAGHGPEWREIAEAFGAETGRYRHCEKGDAKCQPS